MLRIEMGFQDWGKPSIIVEQEIFDDYRTPWPALVRAHPRKAPRILKKIAAAHLVPEAVSHVLLSLRTVFEGQHDARRTLPSAEAQIAKVAKRANASLELLEMLKPEPTAKPLAPVAHITIQTNGTPLHGELVAALEKALWTDMSIWKALESDPPRADVGLFLETSLAHLGLEPIELACILQQHPDALNALHRPHRHPRDRAVEIARWIRATTTRSRKRAATRPRTEPQ
jgi:hypothetical protein